MSEIFLKCTALEEWGIGNLWQLKGKPSEKELQTLGLSISSPLMKKPLFLNQIHSSIIHTIESAENIEKFSNIDGDGWIVLAREIYVALKTADCIPLYLFDKNVPVLALLHCGWKSVYRGIIEKCVKMMEYFGARSSNICAYAAPGIKRDDYIVGEEFRNIFPSSTIEYDGKFFFDIFAEVENRLASIGIYNFKMFSLSTYSTPWLCSHRRDDKFSGRMIFSAWIK